MSTLQIEKKNREKSLQAAGIDTEGFGVLNTFFLYDYLVEHFNIFSKYLTNKGWHKLAFSLSNVSVYQYKVKGFEIRQTVKIKGDSGGYKQDCFVHDHDPEEAIKYVCKKYSLSEDPINN